MPDVKIECPHPKVSKFAMEVLEGGRPPFNQRDKAYGVSGQ